MISLLLILSTAVSINTQSPSSYFASAYVTIRQANGSEFISNASSNYLFAFSFQSPLVGANQAFVALSGYYVESASSFYIYTNIIMNGSANGILEFNSYDDLKVYKMSFCIIYTAPIPYPSLSVESHMINPTNLSNSGWTSAHSGRPKQSFTLASNLYFSNSNFSVITYIACLRNYNRNSTKVVYFNTSLFNISVGSSNFSLAIQIDLLGILYSAKVTVIIFDKSETPVNKVYYASYMYLVFKNFLNQSDSSLYDSPPSIPYIFGEASRNCIFAMTSIANINNGELKYSLFNFSSTTTSGLTNMVDGGNGMAIIRAVFCTVECSPVEFYNRYWGTCSICGEYIYHCLTCENLFKCIKCDNNTYLDALQQNCLCDGFQVLGGCTNITHCQEIDPDTNLCIQCQNNFTVTSNGTCDCLAAQITSDGYCINIQGCLTVSIINGDLKCASANCGLHSYFDSLLSICVCNASLVTGGCTNITYCSEIDPNTKLCIQCQNNFTATSNGTMCGCLAAQITNNEYCINIYGCLTAAVINGDLKCTFLDCGRNAYYDPFMFRCVCNGQWVTGGCSNIKYCQHINSSTCLKCGNNFTLSLNGTRCNCLAGNPTISGYCTGMIGCIAATIVNGSVICLSCDATNRFYLSTSKICNCSNDYSLKGTQCLPVCGDGKVISNEQCDDGNTINGDGCSSMCKIESYYACQNGSASHKSDCYYAYPSIKLILSSTYKISAENVGVFVFTFVPSPGILSKANFSSAVNLTLTPSHRITELVFAEGQLTVTVVYDEDLEGNSAILNLLLDKKIIIHNSFNVRFTVKSNNYPLIVSRYSSHIDFLQLTMKILVGATLVIFVVGSWAHKMIGVETLFPFLFVYFTLGLDSIGDNQLFNPLAQLRHVANYGEFFGSVLESNNDTVSRLNLRTSFAENNSAIIMIVIGGLLGLAAVGAYYKIDERRKMEKERGHHIISNDSSMHFIASLILRPAFFLLFRVVLLPVSLGFLPYVLITAFLLSISNTEQHSPFSAFFTLFLITSSSAIIAAQLVGAAKGSFPRREAAHFSAFTANSILCAALLVLSISHSSFLFFLAGESVVFLATLIFLRPYASTVHCISAILSQAVVCVWAGMIIGLRLGEVSDSKQNFLLAAVGMLVGVDAVGVLRIFWQLKCYTSQRGMLKYKLICKETIKSMQAIAQRPTLEKEGADVQNQLNMVSNRIKGRRPRMRPEIPNITTVGMNAVDRGTFTPYVQGSGLYSLDRRPSYEGPIKQMSVRLLNQNLLDTFT